MIATRRTSNRAPIIDISALKYIRMVIASYVLAIALGIINGFDANLVFSTFLSHPMSLYVSNVFVLFCGLMLFTGYFLRSVSLYLAIVIFAATFQANFLAPVGGSLDALFTDVLLIGGLLACYFPLSQRQLRKQACFGTWQRKARIARARKTHVMPRRVTCSHPTRKRPSTTNTERAVQGLMNMASKAAEQTDPLSKLSLWEQDLVSHKDDLKKLYNEPANIFA